MEDTIFGRIIRREIPAQIVYEDDDVLAFLDRSPSRPGHTLVVPKKAVRNAFDADEETFLKVMRAVHHLAPRVRDAMGAQGMHIAFNSEAAGGQSVFHFHVHLVPGNDEDPIQHPLKEVASDQALREAAEKIRAALA